MKQITAVYFSPTGGTKKAVLNLAYGLAEEIREVREVDLCNVKEDVAFGPEDIVVVGMPVFGGRIPGFGAERLVHIKGGGATAVTAAVYGNRAFEDALVEMNDILKEQGFRIGASTALLAEHSMVRSVAAGRPDESDRQEMKGFASKITAKLNDPSWEEPQVPGDRPYRDWKQMPVAPLADDSCTACGTCAAQCPTGAIPAGAPDTTQLEKCILCLRCIAVCPTHSRSLPPQAQAMLDQKLSPLIGVRRENELFL